MKAEDVKTFLKTIAYTVFFAFLFAGAFIGLTALFGGGWAILGLAIETSVPTGILKLVAGIGALVGLALGGGTGAYLALKRKRSQVAPEQDDEVESNENSNQRTVPSRSNSIDSNSSIQEESGKSSDDSIDQKEPLNEISHASNMDKKEGQQAQSPQKNYNYPRMPINQQQMWQPNQYQGYGYPPAPPWIQQQPPAQAQYPQMGFNYPSPPKNMGYNYPPAPPWIQQQPPAQAQYPQMGFNYPSPPKNMGYNYPPAPPWIQQQQSQNFYSQHPQQPKDSNRFGVDSTHQEKTNNK